jgi:hypothetical protein
MIERLYSFPKYSILPSTSTNFEVLQLTKAPLAYDWLGYNLIIATDQFYLVLGDDYDSIIYRFNFNILKTIPFILPLATNNEIVLAGESMLYILNPCN